MPDAIFVSASTHDGNIPENTLDSDLTTRWSVEGDGQWIQYDLGVNQFVSGLNIAFHHGSLRDTTIDIVLSENGTAWNTVWSGDAHSSSVAPANFDIEDTLARYVKIVGYGNTYNDWTSINEVEINTVNVKETKLSGRYYIKNSHLGGQCFWGQVTWR